MSILSEQINAIDCVGKFLDDLRFGPRMKQAELKERIRRMTRHYPNSVETKIWLTWLLAGKVSDTQIKKDLTKDETF